MAKVKEVLNRIQSVKSAQQITQAMKLVAAAKLNKAREHVLNMRPYVDKLNELLARISSSKEGTLSSPYMEKRDVNKILWVVIASDKGLCGPFNTSLFKYIAAYLERSGDDLLAKLDVLVVGKKSYDYFKALEYGVNKSFLNLLHRLTFEKSYEAAQFILNAFKNQQYDKVELIYNYSENAAKQVVKVEPFLPIDQLEGSPSSLKQEVADAARPAQEEYIYEPTKDSLFSTLIPKTLQVRFYKALLESNVAEQNSRMMAMTKATDNAEELLKELKLTYNRTRQAGITKEILEVVGGAEALSAGH